MWSSASKQILEHWSLFVSTMTPYNIALLLVEVIFMLIGTISNGLVIMVYMCDRRSLRRSVVMILSLFLASGNCLYCAIVNPLQIAIRVTDWNSPENIQVSEYICKAFLGIRFSIDVFVVCLNGLIAVNRYRVVCGSPRERMTTRQVTLAVVFIILLFIPVGVAMVILSMSEITLDGQLSCRLSESARQVWYVVLFVTVLGTAVAIIVLSIKIIRHVKRQQSVIYPMHHAANQTSGSEGGAHTKSGLQSKSNNFLQSNQESMSTSSHWKTPSSVSRTLQVPSTQPPYTMATTNSEPLSEKEQPSTSFQQPVPLPVDRHSNFALLPTPLSQHQSSIEENRFQGQTLGHLTKSLLAITLTFSINWLCVFILVVVLAVIEIYITSNLSTRLLLFIIGTLLQMNHIIPPFILGYTSPTFRQALRRLIHHDWMVHIIYCFLQSIFVTS